MPLEIERKYLDVDFAGLRASLRAAGAAPIGVRFETNILCDDAEGSFASSGRLARLRVIEKADGAMSIFTVKWPAAPGEGADASCKAREELEAMVGSFAQHGPFHSAHIPAHQPAYTSSCT